MCCLISPIRWIRLISEWQSVGRPQSRVACRDYLRIWHIKNEKKNRSSKRQCHSEFPRRGSKTNYEVMYLFWVMVFLWLRRKIDNWKIYHRPIVAVYMKILLLSVWKESITENFVKRNFGSQRSRLGISAHFEEKLFTTLQFH